MAYMLPFFLLAVFGMFVVCQGLTCTPLTGKTCKKSLYVTGECLSGVCQCFRGTVPEEYGCHKKVKPRMIVEVISGGELTEYERWSGELTPHSEVHLTCYPSNMGDGQYKWYLNGTELQNKKNYRFDPALKSANSKYQCSVNIRGSKSDKSDEIVLNFMRPGDQFTKKPVVAGMPGAVENNSFVTVQCNNVPAFLGRFVFSLEGEKDTVTLFSNMGFEVNADRLNKTVTCSIKPNDKKIEVISSDPVRFPAGFSDQIPDVFIKGKDHFYAGGNLDFWCAFSKTFAVGSSDVLTYRWSGPHGAMPDQTGQEYYKDGVTSQDAGNYSCTAIYNNRTVRSSPTMTVKVIQVGRTSLQTEPKYPVLGGFIRLECQHQGFIPPTSPYSWDYGISLQSYSDNALQFNNLRAEDLGHYITCSSLYRISYDTRFIPAPLPMSTLIQPKTEGASKPHDKDKYDFACTSDYDTPGMKYEWYIDGVKQEDGRHSIYEYRQSSSKPTDVSCRLSFNSGLSEYSKKCTIPAKGSIMAPVIVVDDSPTSFIQGSSYTLKCSCFHQGGAHYTWKKDGMFIRSSSSLLLQNITSKNNGQYTCTIKLGKESKNSEPLKIVARDKIDTPKIKFPLEPPLFMNATVAKIRTGNSYYLLCSSTAHNEFVKYKWTQNGIPDPRAHDRVYHIHNAKDSDNGRYRCTMEIADISKDSNALRIIIVSDHPKSGSGYSCGHLKAIIGLSLVVSCLKQLNKIPLID